MGEEGWRGELENEKHFQFLLCVDVVVVTVLLVLCVVWKMFSSKPQDKFKDKQLMELENVETNINLNHFINVDHVFFVMIEICMNFCMLSKYLKLSLSLLHLLACRPGIHYLRIFNLHLSCE